MGPWILFGLALTGADGISIDDDPFGLGPAPAQRVCWVVASHKGRRGDRTRLSRAISRAAEVTRPAHVRLPVARIRSVRKDSKGCRGILLVTVRGTARRARITVKVRNPDETRFTRVAQFRSALAKLERGQFEAPWTEAWARFAPPAPPAPPPPPPLPPQKLARPFVDKDLAQEQAVGANGPPTAPAGPPIASVWVEAGYFSRRLADAPGAEQSGADVPTAGLRAEFHAASFFEFAAEHELDVIAGYHRRFVTGEQDSNPVSVAADRAALTARYRWSPGSRLPRFGPQLGYEFVRFDSDGASVLSTRFSVVRVGIDVSQPILRWSAGRVDVIVDSALRWSPSGDAGLGVDATGGAVARFDFGLALEFKVRFDRQTGEASGQAFAQQTLDALVAVGWSI